MDDINIPKYDLSKGSPHVSPELISYLRALFPNKLPIHRPESIRDIDFMMGQQKIVDHLEQVHRSQITPTSEKD